MQRSIIAALALLAASGCDDDKATKAETKATATATATAAPAPPPPDPHRNDYKKPTVEGSVTFDGLKDGGKVEGKNIMGMVATNLKFKVEGMSVAEEGPVKINTGHFVVLVDGKAVPEEKSPPEQGKIFRYGKAETGGVVPLSEGKHTLTLQFVDARDRSYGDKWSQTITVTAKSK